MSKYVLEGLCWSFIGDAFERIEAFEAELKEYQLDILGEKFNELSLNELVIVEPSIRVKYWCYEGDRQVEPIVTLNAGNGNTFTTVGLMFHLHNAVVSQLDDIDHHFFQGLAIEKEQDASLPTLYKLQQGS
jgi:hypothetical protein